MGDYEVFFIEHVIKGEWRFERTYGQLEGKMFSSAFHFTLMFILGGLWEELVPNHFVWTIAVPLYVNWIAFTGYDFLKPWKSPILLAVLVSMPYNLIRTT